MDMLTIFVALTAIAILLQAGLLLGMYLTMRKSTERMEALASEVRTKVLPTLEQVQEVLTEVRPKVTTIVANAEHATTVLRGQLERIDATVNDVVDRARLQIIRGDEMLTRTMDRVEQTTEIVQRTVVSPVRRVSGLMQGITVGLEYFSGGAAETAAAAENAAPFLRMKCLSELNVYSPPVIPLPEPGKRSMHSAFSRYLIVSVILFLTLSVSAQQKTVWSAQEQPDRRSSSKGLRKLDDTVRAPPQRNWLSRFASFRSFQKVEVGRERWQTFLLKATLVATLCRK